MSRRRLVGSVATVALALVWLAAAVLKSLDPAAFAAQISLQRLLPAAWCPYVAYGFIVAEMLLAFALLTGWRRRAALAASACLMLLFIGVTARTWALGYAEECGCFGRLAARGPAATIAEDAGFIALALAGLLAGNTAGPARRAKITFAALVPLAVVLPLAGPYLPVDSLVTDLRPGADLSDLAVDNFSTPLDRGHVLLALVTDGCDACDAAVAGLNAIVRAEDGTTVAGVFIGDRARAQEWTLVHVPEFEVGDAPEVALRRYFRRPPRVALLVDGIVREVWNRPPTPGELRRADPG